MKPLALPFLFLSLVLLALPGPARAHRVNVFAYVEGQVLHVEATFQRGVPARQGAVEVRNARTGALYAQAETDAAGQATLALPAQAREDRADLDILLRAGEGHQNRWTIKATEYLPAAAPARPAQSAPRSSQPAAAPIPVCPPAPDPGPLLKAAVEREIAPLRQRLQAAQQPGLPEIVGGLGYLVGIAGLVAYFRARRLAGSSR